MTSYKIHKIPNDKSPIIILEDMTVKDFMYDNKPVRLHKFLNSSMNKEMTIEDIFKKKINRSELSKGSWRGILKTDTKCTFAFKIYKIKKVK